MRIFSKQKDYYDSALAYGVDNNVFFKRKTEEIAFDSKVLRFGHLGDGCNIFNGFSSETKKIIETINNVTPNLSFGYRNKFNIYNVFFGAVLFCGKIYPYIKIRAYKNLKLLETEDVYSYNLLSLEKKLSKVIGKDKTKDFLNSKKSDLFREKESILCDIFSDYFNTDINVDTIKIHHTFDTPYLDFFCNKVFKTPSLSDLDFATTVSPFTAYQNIEMFISGVLGGSSPKTLEISDIHRLEAHGFDKKTSFRKEKSKNK